MPWHVIFAARHVADGYVKAVTGKSAAVYAATALLNLTCRRPRPREDGAKCSVQSRDFANVLPMLETVRRQLVGVAEADDGHTLREAMRLLLCIAHGDH